MFLLLSVIKCWATTLTVSQPPALQPHRLALTSLASRLGLSCSCPARDTIVTDNCPCYWDRAVVVLAGLQHRVDCSMQQDTAGSMGSMTHTGRPAQENDWTTSSCHSREFLLLTWAWSDRSLSTVTRRDQQDGPLATQSRLQTSDFSIYNVVTLQPLSCSQGETSRKMPSGILTLLNRTINTPCQVLQREL